MKHFLFLFIFIYTFNCFGQTKIIKAIKTDSINIDADEYYGYDGFGNCVYAKNNVLYKKVESTVLEYQNLALGNIKKVDILNPLKVVLFYEEFNSVIILDNQLNEIQKIDFSINEIPILAKAVGMSGQNKLWVFNSISQKIGLYDLVANSYLEVGLPIQENLLFYQTDFNYFHFIDSQNQWLTSTIYGRIINNGILYHQNQMSLLEKNQVIYIKNDSLYLLDRNIAQEYKIENVKKSIKKYYYKDQILSIFTNHGITNYKITLP